MPEGISSSKEYISTDSCPSFQLKLEQIVHSFRGRGYDLNNPVRRPHASFILRFGQITDYRKIRFQIDRVICVQINCIRRNIHFTRSPMGSDITGNSKMHLTHDLLR